MLSKLGIDKINGAVLDLGVSSYQLDEASRGFSYMHDAPLDMRMDRTASLTAYEVVNTYSERELSRILKEYGEELFASKIASRICTKRQETPIKTTLELAEIITSAIPQKFRFDGGNPKAFSKGGDSGNIKGVKGFHNL